MLLGALQSSYLPWLGYFDQIERCDLFIIYDDLQYTRRDWRNRNRIKTPLGARWLSVPVLIHGDPPPLIKDVAIDNSEPWARRHWLLIRHNYGRAPFFDRYAPRLQAIYTRPWHFLADLNRALIECLVQFLAITTRIVYSSQEQLEFQFEQAYGPMRDATDRILFLCERYGAGRFLEGSSGRNYIREDKLKTAPFRLIYHDYRHPVYPQRFGPFLSHLSVIDLLFNVGPNSLDVLSGRQSRGGRKKA